MRLPFLLLPVMLVSAACATEATNLTFGAADPRAMIVLATDALEGDQGDLSYGYLFQAVSDDRKRLEDTSLEIVASALLGSAQLRSHVDAGSGLKLFVGSATPGEYVLVRSQSERGFGSYVTCHAGNARVVRFAAGRVSVVTADRFGRPLEDEASALARVQEDLARMGGVSAPVTMAHGAGRATFTVGRDLVGRPNCYPAGPVYVESGRDP